MPFPPLKKNDSSKKDLSKEEQIEKKISEISQDFTQEEYEHMESLESKYWDAQDEANKAKEKMKNFVSEKKAKLQEKRTEILEDLEELKEEKKKDEESSFADSFVQHIKNNPLLNMGGEKEGNSKQGGGQKNTPNGFLGGPQNWIQILLLGVSLIFVFDFFSGPSHPEISVSEFVSEYTEGNFTEITLTGDSATAVRSSGETVKVILGNRDSFKNFGLLDPETQGDTKVSIKSSEGQKFWIDLLLSFLPLILILGLMVYSMRGMKGMGGFPFGGGQKGTEPIKPNTKFEDVAGQDEAKFELEEVVDFLKKPTRFIKMGAKIPKGVLLSGPPGTGKTLLARAVAGEAHVPFFSISGSEFVEMFVGVGASRVRGLFSNARKQSPSIIFIDEIDAIGRKRSNGMGGGNDEREQTLNQILTEMDGFENETGVIVIAATNRVEILDKALLRPGRFDRRITVNNPTIKDRVEILKVHSKKKPLAEEVSLEKLSARTVGFSGADLENLMNESAIFAARAKRSEITNVDVDLALDRITMGTEKKSLVMSHEEKKMTSYHEIGHAMMAYLLPTADPVHKITIVPRGMALGATHIAPEKESYHTTKQKYFEEICVLLGGLSAEKIIFDDTTSGVSNDLERATAIANAMVKKFGMSDELGPLVFADPGEESFARKHSEEYAKLIDSEVQKIVKEAYDQTKRSLTENLKTLHSLSQALLEKETLSREEFESFFQ